MSHPQPEGEAREHPLPLRALQPRPQLQDGAEDAHGHQGIILI